MKRKTLLIILALLLNSSFLINNCMCQWVQMSNGIVTTQYVRALTVVGASLFAGTDGGVFLSSNNGTSWTSVGLTNQVVNSFAVSGTNLFAGTPGGGVFLSTNNGTSWNQVNNGLTNQVIEALAVFGTKIFVGTNGGGVFLSTNNGSNWSPVNNGLTTQWVWSLAVSGTNLFAGTAGGVFLSTNNGSNWSPVNNGLTNQVVMALLVSGTNIFAGTQSGLFLSTNNGSNWSAVNNGLTNQDVHSFAVSGTNIFAGTAGGGVFLSTNNGTSWTQKNQGFNVVPHVDALIIANNYIFAGTFNQSVWRRSLSEIIGIQNISTETPSKYSLSQNYPNPFNPSTNIKFNVEKLGNIKIIVYDIAGREVQTLVNERLQPGTYEANFDAGNLPSGIYFYSLFANDSKIDTKKMIVLK